MQVGWLGLGAMGPPWRRGRPARDTWSAATTSCRAVLRPWREMACGPRTRQPPRPAALPVRAEEVDQDGGDHFGRGVVIVSVEHREQRTGRGSGLFRD